MIIPVLSSWRRQCRSRSSSGLLGEDLHLYSHSGAGVMFPSFAELAEFHGNHFRTGVRVRK